MNRKYQNQKSDMLMYVDFVDISENSTMYMLSDTVRNEYIFETKKQQTFMPKDETKVQKGDVVKIRSVSTLINMENQCRIV